MNVRSIADVPLLARKTCGERQCPNEVKNLWAKAHLAVMRWDEFMEHPNDPDLRSMVKHHMEMLRAAAKIAEPMMEVRLEASMVAAPAPPARAA